MRPNSLRHLALVCLCASLFACKKEEQPAQPAPTGSATESSADPRLAPEPGDPPAADPHAGLGAGDGDAGAAGSPHGGNPHAGVGGGAPAGGGGMGMGAPGKAPEKTADGRVVLGPVTAKVPKSWKEKPPSSGMRAAEWTIPGKEGEAELAVFFFGSGGAGGAQANLDRWIGQFAQADGSDSKKKAKTETKKVAGMPVTLVEVTGRYVAAVMPGQSEKHDKPDHMLLGAIVETSAGPYYFKLVGPKATVTGARKDFLGFIESQKPGEK
jgi:hypothetical protein